MRRFAMIPIFMMLLIGCSKNPLTISDMFQFLDIAVTDDTGEITSEVASQWLPRIGSGLFHLTVSPAYPNPTSSTIHFRYSVRALSDVKILLFRSFFDEGIEIYRQVVDTGFHEYVYDFDDGQGGTLPDGYYRVVIIATTSDEREFLGAGNIQLVSP